MRITKTAQLIILLALVMIAGVAGYYMFFVEIRDSNQAISLRTNELNTNFSKGEELRTLENIARDTKEDRTKLDSFFITEDDIVVFLENIESLEGDTGANISVESISKKQVEESSIIEKLDLNITVNGTWRSVYHFLVLLESLPYHVVFSKVQYTGSVSSLEEVEDEWRGSFSFSVTKLK